MEWVEFGLSDVEEEESAQTEDEEKSDVTAVHILSNLRDKLSDDEMVAESDDGDTQEDIPISDEEKTNAYEFILDRKERDMDLIDYLQKEYRGKNSSEIVKRKEVKEMEVKETQSDQVFSRKRKMQGRSKSSFFSAVDPDAETLLQKIRRKQAEKIVEESQRKVDGKEEEEEEEEEVVVVAKKTKKNKKNKKKKEKEKEGMKKKIEVEEVKDKKKNEENKIDVHKKEEKEEESSRKLPGWMDSNFEEKEAKAKEEESRRRRAAKESFRKEASQFIQQTEQKVLAQFRFSKKPMMAGRVICFDLETTGFGGADSIVEIGAVEIIDGRRTGVLFQAYAKPDAPVHPMAFEVHGLSAEFLASQPPVSEVVNSFIKWVGESPLVAHNMAFDIRMLHQEAERYALRLQSKNFFCTQRYFSQLYPGMPCSLDSISAYFGFGKEFHRKKHGALVDSEILALLFQKLCEVTNKKEKEKEKKGEKYYNHILDQYEEEEREKREKKQDGKERSTDEERKSNGIQWKPLKNSKARPKKTNGTPENKLKDLERFLAKLV